MTAILGRLARRHSAAAAALFLMILPVGVLAPAYADSEHTAVARFASCLAAHKPGDLLLLFDESGSLRDTDPHNSRLQAASILLKNLTASADRNGADLSVAVAGFSVDYVPEKDWSKLTGANLGQLTNALSAIADKNKGADTDYLLALEGARDALAKRGTDRCQAVVWFSDGMIDFSPRHEAKPYAPDVFIDQQAGVDELKKRNLDGICRPGGAADQLRASGIVTLAVGLTSTSASGAPPEEFDQMSAISTGHGIRGTNCGAITDPPPGDFVLAANIDDVLFGFDALNPDPGVNSKGGVCPQQVCPDARHNFVLDRSIKAVNILGSGGQAGVVPHLVAPTGEELPLPQKVGETPADLAGVHVTYKWQSDSAQTISLQTTDPTRWAGQWAIVYVDTTGQHPDAVSRVNIHISTDIFPTLTGADQVSWHSGQVIRALTFGLADGARMPVPAAGLAGTAIMTATLVPDGGTPLPVLTAAGKDDIGKPVDADLTNVNPGHAVLKMSLKITTAPATGPGGSQIAPGTALSPQDVELPVQILPKVGMPIPGRRVDFGEVQAAAGSTAGLDITGPGCVWLGPDAPKVTASPTGIGTVHITSINNSAQTCFKVAAGQKVTLPISLRTDSDGNGGLDGSLIVHVASLDNPSDSQPVTVPFSASMIKPLNPTNFVLVLLAALLLGPGIPLALLYLSKWWVTRIPGAPLLAERIPLEVARDQVLRDGEPFALAATDLVTPVPGMGGAGTRQVTVHGVTLTARTGWSPFGAGRVEVSADGRIGVGSQVPGSDSTGLQAVLPLAVHNTWVVLHNPNGPATAAEVLVLVAGTTDTAAREQLYAQVGARLPALLNGLRARATAAGAVAGTAADTASPSPFGRDAGTVGRGDAADPFGAAGTAGPPFSAADSDAGGTWGQAQPAPEPGPAGPSRPPPQPFFADDAFDPFQEGN